MRSRLLVLILLAVAGVSIVNSFRANAGRIARARADAERLAAQRDSIATVVEHATRAQARLRRERDVESARADALRDSVTALELARAERQLTVRTIRRTADLEARIAETFPELAASPWGLTTVPFEDGDTLGLEFLMVPAWFAETFVIDHENAVSWRAQRDRLLEVDSLRRTVARLQDSVIQLERANRLAYETGYREAYAGYEDLSRRYVAELRKPRVTLGRTIGLVAAVGAGVVLGAVVR